MRDAMLWVCVATLWASVGGCEVDLGLDDGTFPCNSDEECAPDFVCVEQPTNPTWQGFCYPAPSGPIDLEECEDGCDRLYTCKLCINDVDGQCLDIAVCKDMCAQPPQTALRTMMHCIVAAETCEAETIRGCRGS